MCKITLGRILRNRDSFSNRARVSNCLAAEMLRHEFLTRCTCAAISIRPGRVERTDGRDGREAPILMVIFKARCWIRERDLDCKRPLSTVMMEHQLCWAGFWDAELLTLRDRHIRLRNLLMHTILQMKCRSIYESDFALRSSLLLFRGARSVLYVGGIKYLTRIGPSCDPFYVTSVVLQWDSRNFSSALSPLFLAHFLFPTCLLTFLSM